MSTYATEPVPTGIDPVLSEYLMRQLIGIQNALNTSGILIEVAVLPRPISGGIVNLNDQTNPSGNGIYACVVNSQGVGEWKKLQAI